jgi:hypothetical protein
MISPTRLAQIKRLRSLARRAKAAPVPFMKPAAPVESPKEKGDAK